MASLLRLQDPPEPEAGKAESLRFAWSPRLGSFIVSGALHAAVVVTLFHLPTGIFDDPGATLPRRYEVAMLPKPKEVLWLPLPDKLPDVSPEERIGNAPEPQGREQSLRESIIVQPPDAPPGRQFVHIPDNPKRLENDVPARNMIAVEGERAKPKPKAFVPPEPQPAPSRQPDFVDAPEIQMKGPELAAASLAVRPLQVAKPRPRAFVAPTEPPKLALPVDVALEAPPDMEIAGGGATGLQENKVVVGQLSGPAKPPRRRFVLTEGGVPGGTGTSKDPVLDAPPELKTGGGLSGSVTAAVIGLNPGPGDLPDGSRKAAFSRAPRLGEPASGEGADGLRAKIPNVAIQDSGGKLSPSPPPVSEPASRTVIFEVRVPPSAATMSAPLHPHARTIPRSIEEKFRERVVYAIVVPKPDLAVYGGDWRMWFAERAQAGSAVSPMRAPLPFRKTTKNAAGSSDSGQEVWVQVTAVIGRDGKVISASPLPGRNPDVAAEAARDLAEWEFRPAARRGEPVEVEAVFEIPFRGRPNLARHQ